MNDWVLRHKRDVVLGVLLFLVSTISFALGYLAAGEFSRSPIIIEQVQRQ